MPSSPYLNRFLQPDTIIPNPSNPQSWNRFSYVLNNPIRYSDPSGHGVDCGVGMGCVSSNPQGRCDNCGSSGSNSGSSDSLKKTLDKMPATKKVYERYLELYKTPGWWNGNKSGNFSVWQFLNLLLSMEFQRPGTNWSPALLQETVTRNFYTQCGSYCTSSDPLAVLRYIAVKQLNMSHDVSPGSLVKNEINRPSYNSTDFAAAFLNHDQSWNSGAGDGNVPYDWGNTSLKDCTASTCPWMSASMLKSLPEVKVRFGYAEANSPYAGADEAPTTQTNLFYSIAGYGNTAFIVTQNQSNCLYQGLGFKWIGKFRAESGHN